MDNATATQFVLGFMDATGLDSHEVADQWAAFSRQLTDGARDCIEAGGYEAGIIQGRSFREMYPNPATPSD
jgi:hypothetical protein